MAEAPPSSPVATPSVSRTESPVRHTLWFLLAYYSIAILWGVRNIWFWRRSPLDLLLPVAVSICLGWWAVVDARARKRPIPVLAQPWFFLLAGLVVPGYVIRSRGWRGAAWVVVHAIGWYALATVAMHVGGTVVFRERWWRAMGL